MTDFSYQLYSSRNFGPLADTLSMLSGMGYKEVEGYGALYKGLDDLGALKGLLAANGLRMPTAHFGLDMLEGDPARAVEIAKTLGIETVYCPHIGPDDRPDDAEGWKTFGMRLDRAGAMIRAEGLGFGWHNHAFEFEKQADGSVPMESILEGAPELEWEADIAWIVRGGGDPLAWIDREGDRITSVHMKDIAPAGEKADEDGWADVGQGVLDWQGLWAALKATPAKHFVMEHDNPSDDARFAKNALTAAQSY
ncbi:sugar phosphate isomerase/epimerase family protein [Algicella marina]|uniref:TIM barrel protein n=1 Tax=Algicella marina TaxID=2683284 RepID=A0A6P1SX78_9RHOB|nr:sugar phosphate isomerase/epimerase [Algicella marina]QHQ33943.1 TIM barrel protein [Algicella marina]